MTLIDKLKEIKKEAENRTLVQKREFELANEAKRKEQILRSEKILLGLESKLEKAAAKNKSSFVVMKCSYNDVKNFSFSGVTKTKEDLELASLMVFEHLEKEGLNPTITYQHDGIGMESWYELRANW